VEFCGTSTRSEQEGYVYIVSRDLDQDCFKIGFSRYDPSERVSCHRKCYDGVTLIAQTNLIPFARRVEQLAHWNLSTHRRREHCGRCNCEHREWFHVSKDKAIDAVIRWAGWICSQPYKTQSGCLKSFWARRLVKRSDLYALGRYYSDVRPGQDWTDLWKGKDSRACDYRSEIVGHLKKVEISRYD
jgi:T5orf172 domain